MSNSQGGIYQIVNTATGHIYIGSTTKFSRRWGQHRRELNTGKHGNFRLQKDWRHYGSNVFEFRIVEVVEGSLDELWAREQHWINQGGDLYNLAPVIAESADRLLRTARIRTNLTLDPDTLAVLQELIDDGLYPNLSRALDAAARRLKRYHQLRGEARPDPPDPGDEDDNSSP
jgi:hypothetical protein